MSLAYAVLNRKPLQLAEEHGRLEFGQPVVAGEVLAGEIGRSNSGPAPEPAKGPESHNALSHFGIVVMTSPPSPEVRVLLD